MSEPRRLLDEATDDFTRGMIESARADGPGARSYRKAAVALGLGTATLGVAGTTSAGVAGAKAATASLSALVVAKWVGVAAVGIATTVAVVQVARAPAHPRLVSHPQPAATLHASERANAPAVRHVEAPVEMPAVTTVTTVEAPAATTETAAMAASSPAIVVPQPVAVAQRAPFIPSKNPVPALPAAAPPAATPLPTKEGSLPSSIAGGATPPVDLAFRDPPSPPPPPARHAGSTLFAETSALDVARSALRAHQPARALPALDAYDARFPQGSLAPEAAVLRIEALHAMGDREGAARLSDAFLAAHPSSPLADRVRKLAPAVSIP